MISLYYGEWQSHLRLASDAESFLVAVLPTHVVTGGGESIASLLGVFWVRSTLGGREWLTADGVSGFGNRQQGWASRELRVGAGRVRGPSIPYRVSAGGLRLVCCCGDLPDGVTVDP